MESKEKNCIFYMKIFTYSTTATQYILSLCIHLSELPILYLSSAYLNLAMPIVFKLEGGSPWGFRLTGGKDFGAPLAVSRTTPGGKAERAKLKCGMIISEINGESTANMTHLIAQNKVKEAGSFLRLTVDEDEIKSRDHTAPLVKSPDPVPPAPKPTSQTHKSTATFQTSKWQPPQAKPTPPAPSNDDFLPPPPQELLIPELRQDMSQDDPICEGCRKVIHGPYLSHQGKNWHPDEFVCAASNCRKPLQNVGFIEENGQKYCKDCYSKHFAPTCEKCLQKIIGEIMHALNKTWHMTCFVCSACQEVFKEGVFQMHEDKPYCIPHYNEYFGQVCKGCNFAIEAGDQYLEALKAQWHESCFRCAVCHCDLKSVGFFAAGGKPVCSNHRNARIA